MEPALVPFCFVYSCSFVFRLSSEFRVFAHFALSRQNTGKRSSDHPGYGARSGGIDGDTVRVLPRAAGAKGAGGAGGSGAKARATASAWSGEGIPRRRRSSLLSM